MTQFTYSVIGLSLILMVGGPSLASAQSPGTGGPPPPGWQVLTDDVGADASAITFASMEPGFHLTTGPAALFYDPSTTARGNFRVEATIHLFEPGAPSDGFGLFIGGSDLDGSYQMYTAFLMRGTGEYKIERRLSFTSSETLTDWTGSESMVAWSDRDEGAKTVENTLALEARDQDLVFFVNGEEVQRLPRGRDAVDGVVGLRVNDGVDIHVTAFDVSPL